MEDGDGYPFSEDSLSDDCDKSSRPQHVFQSLKTKYESPQSPKDSTMDEDHNKLSCYNNIGKNVHSKESNDLKVKLNGDVGSGIDTLKCDTLVIHEENSKSKLKVGRTCSETNVVDGVNDGHGSLEVVARKRKTCESPDLSSAQHDNIASKMLKTTSSKKMKFSHVSIPTQSVIPQAETPISKQISEDSTTLQTSSSSLIESQSSTVSHQAAEPDAAEPDTHLTGFAQYLGLQPIVKFRCFKCEETGFPTLLKLQEHQNACLKNLKVSLIPKPSPPHISVHPSLSSTNFRISRKVFLCGSCGTYYENWNLFLHMREVHKRLICLYCLNMFSQIDMLSSHLTAKHGIVETVHSSPEELLSDCKGSCFLMCCDCDAIFTERDDFANHICTEKIPANTACQFCGLLGTHLSACPRAVTRSNTVTTSASCSFLQTDARSSITDPKHSPPVTPRGASVTKYLIPISSVQVPYKKTTVNKSHVLEDNQEHSNELSDVDDDYDISNAASFCHVNIHEPLEKQVPVSEKTCIIIKTADTPSSIGTQSTPVLSMTKPAISLNEPTANTGLLGLTTVCPHNTCPLDDKSDPMDKAVTINNKLPTVEDSLLLNKPLEQTIYPGPELINTTCMEESTNGSNSLESSEENYNCKPCPKLELNQSFLQTVLVNTCTSPQTTEMDTDNVSSPEKHDTFIPTSRSQEPCIPTTPLKPELTCTSPPIIGVVGTTSPTNDLTDAESSNASEMSNKSPAITDAYVNDVKRPASTNSIDGKPPDSLDIIDVKSPASTDVMDVKSPTSTYVIDSESSISVDVIDVKLPAIMEAAIVKSPARIDAIDVKSSASLDTIDVRSSAKTDALYSKLHMITVASGSKSQGSYVTNPKSPLKSEVIEVQSPVKGDMAKSIVQSDVGDSKSPVRARDVKSPIRRDDAKSPVTMDVAYSKSPIRAERIDVQSPVRTDEAEALVGTYVTDSKAPVRLEDIDVQSPLRTDNSKSPVRTDTDTSRSPVRVEGIDVQSPLRTYGAKSPVSKLLQITDLHGSKSPPTNTDWNISKLPLIAELEDSSTSSLRIELNNYSESTTSKDLSKSPLEFNDSKSPSSEDLNNSPRTSSLPELDTSESPIRTTVMNDSSRTSSRASSIDDALKSPISPECHNTQNSTDSSCSSPLTISESAGNLQQSLKNTSSSDTLASLTFEDRCKEITTKSNSDIGIKLQMSSNGTHVIVPKTKFNVGIPSKKRKKGKSRSSPKSALMTANVDTLASDENDTPLFTDFEQGEEKTSKNNAIINTKSKRKKAAKGAKRFNKKFSCTSKTGVENFSESENNIPEDLPLKAEEMSDYIQLAGDEVSVIELHLEDDLEALTIQVVLQESVKTSCPSCVYCNHAKKIAVNGKQLTLHLLAEHRFLPVYSKCENTSDMSYLSADESPSKMLHPCEELSTQVPATEETEKSTAVENKVLMEQYVNKLKMSLPNLQELFLNTDTYDSSDRTFSHPYDRTYECFHCNFLTILHKELYVHNRKMHQKTILLCIMCKSNFYSYSELLCHLCPGIYVPESNIHFRCHICSIDSLPSTFRLMVHLRKRHFVCDVCLETTDDQQKLSTHVWKHKLHHLCYRCGIAYRNKPDITKHLFWKHGTESVCCKKCLQKKWPHVYHFCIPPNAFVCEECNASFTRAVALKVHKRLHTGDLLHGCEECEERFISKRLLSKHQDKHREKEEAMDEEQRVSPENAMLTTQKEELTEREAAVAGEKSTIDHDHISNHLESQLVSRVETPIEDTLPVASPAVPSTVITKKAEKKVDVYDLPPLNLSSDSDESDGEQDAKTNTATNANDTVDVGEVESTKSENPTTQGEDDSQQPVTVVDGIWDNFQNYKANLERRESQSSENVISTNPPILQSTALVLNARNVLLDHDYCVVDEDKDGLGTEKADHVPSTSLSVLDPPEQGVALTDEDGKIESDKNNSFDHDYCFNKDGTNEKSVVQEEDYKEKTEPMAPCIDSSSGNVDASIKKQKTQKKKKRSASSSSSDSSSTSGSSSCSCGENCSCSSSSSSSGSSSDSSESDKSTSGSRGRQIARKERREKVRRKKEEEATSRENLAITGTQDVDELNQTCEPSEPEEKEVPILESDLDTDETETDEDFYDQHPQLLANKLMAEKRNQLLLLAAVAPVNNISPQPELPTPSISEVSPQRKKVKSKKRKKRQHDSDKSSENKLKLSLSTNYFNYHSSNPDFYKPAATESHSFNPLQNFSQSSRLPPAPSIPNTVEPTGMSSAAESGSETDSKRLSKRRRMPKKFYGDSSDEDSSSLNAKWSRKPQSALTSTPIPCPPLTPPSVYKSIHPLPEPARIPPIALNVSEPEKSDEEDGAETESEQGDVKKSSSESSSESEGGKEMEIHTDSDAEPPLVVETAPVQQQQVAKKNENLYCYCQCPYDEVSEMIACDGKDCTIEWFHFECVGIMVPPKGKWFCPDCKKSVPTKNPYFS